MTDSVHIEDHIQGQYFLNPSLGAGRVLATYSDSAITGRDTAKPS